MDLHLHTPASDDWAGDAPTPAEYVERAIAAGLRAIAVTDHQTGEWIDQIKSAAEGIDLTIFPGVEVNSLAGTEGIHLVVLFDVDATCQDIDRFLAAIGAVGGVGADRRRSTATLGILQVLDKVREFKGIAVLAHCQSTKGVLGEMRGDVRASVIQHPAVLAAEAHAEEFYDSAKAESHKRTYDLLDGTDPAYKRKLAVFQSSDNPVSGAHGHHLTSVGSRYTYFYVEDPICLESLRQCFIDREVRIEYPPQEEVAPTTESRIGFPRISEISVTGGFLDSVTLALHAGLTTLIGPKGSGKSMVVELIRFVLDQQPTQPEIRKDHDTKLSTRLGLYGQVTVTAVDASGSEHRITRTYDPANDNPFAETPFNVAELFPCHLLSQGEIVRLAERETEQIKFIDSFFDFRSHQRGIHQVRESLSELDKQVAIQVRARKAISGLQSEDQTLAERIDAIDKQLKSPVFARYQAAQQKQQALANAIHVFTDLSDALRDANSAAGAVAIPDLPGELSGDPVVRRVVERATNPDRASRGVRWSAGSLGVVSVSRRP